MTIRADIPDGARTLDLEASRAARAEARAAAGEANPYLKLAAGYVEVRPEVAVSVATDFQEGRVHAGLEGLVVDPADVNVLLLDGISVQDVTAILTFVTGLDAGESVAS